MLSALPLLFFKHHHNHCTIDNFIRNVISEKRGKSEGYKKTEREGKMYKNGRMVYFICTAGTMATKNENVNAFVGKCNAFFADP